MSGGGGTPGVALSAVAIPGRTVVAPQGWRGLCLEEVPKSCGIGKKRNNKKKFKLKHNFKNKHIQLYTNTHSILFLTSEVVLMAS